MEKPDWNSLLQQALTLPGTLSKAYSVFHDYSLGNAILAAFQLAARGLPLAPIASFNRWKNLGRKVRKGEKALSLIMPVTVKRKDKDEVTQEEGTGGAYMIFLLKRNWFSLDQTEGEALQPEVWTPATARGMPNAVYARWLSILLPRCHGRHFSTKLRITCLATRPRVTRRE